MRRMSSTSVLSTVGDPGKTPGDKNTVSTRVLRQEWDAALPADHNNVTVNALRLQYMYHGKPLKALHNAFTTRNAKRYLTLMRICSWLLVLANVGGIGYDVARFKDRDVLKFLLIIRFVVIIPACAMCALYTYTKHYIRHPNWVVAPCLYFAAGIIAYSVVGDDPGYGTLALMIVFTYSFTPIDFFTCTIMSAVEISAFVALLLAFTDQRTSDRTTLVGTLALFWLAVGFVGFNLERSLRQSFLNEVVLRRQRDQLSIEKKRSDQLLANMLPKQIAAQLKDGRSVVADEFASVTVLFCEICDWSSVTDKVDADSVVTLLNRIYSKFDALIERHNVYKVETVGEVYMVVGGCPTRDPNHAVECGKMALDMMAAMPALRQECSRLVGGIGKTLNIRIGLNSGPIVAGIVGIKNPRYKLFGDTVNTASRMESTSVHGKIQASDRTYPLIASRFHLTPRGKIPVKGKGMMETYFVEGLLSLENVSDINMPPAEVTMSAEVVSKPPQPRRGASFRFGGPAVELHPTDSKSAATPNTAELWRAGGNAAAAAARALFEIDHDMGDKQHLVDIFARHGDADVDDGASSMEGSSKSIDPLDECALDDARPAALITHSSNAVVPIRSRHKGRPRGAGLGGGPNDSQRIPSFTINREPRDGPQAPNAVSLDATDLGVKRVESMKVEEFDYSSRMDLGRPVAFGAGDDDHADESKTKPSHASPPQRIQEEAPSAASKPTRTFSGNRRQGSSSAGQAKYRSPPTKGRVISGRDLTQLVTVSHDHKRLPEAGLQPPNSARPSLPGSPVAGVRRRRRSMSRRGIKAVMHAAKSLPRDAGWALCFYRPSDTRIGSMEQFFQEASQRRWVRFVQASGVLAILALGLFALQDLNRYDRDDMKERKRHDMIMIIRYGITVPLLLLYLCLTRLPAFKAPPSKSYAIVQASSVLVILLVGMGIVAISVVGEEPGFGVLAVYIVFCFNISLIAYFYRAVVLFSLIIGHLVCITTVNNVRGFDVIEQMSYLLLFYVGQGLPVLGREYYMRSNYIRQQKMSLQKGQLRLETERTDRVLRNLLPEDVARELKSGAKCIAGHFEMATILFTDMKGFTAFSSKISPQQLVGFLNTMYSKFDMIANKYGIHKVEIIGDAYFSVAGCPNTVPDHAERCAAAALEMLEYMPELRRRAGSEITMRVGIHTGPLVAGVVGVKDPRYHLFGNTVNLAMAMESNGVPGKVHISPQTHRWLKQRLAAAEVDPTVHKDLRGLGANLNFTFEPREAMDILGHTMQTFILGRHRAHSASQQIPGRAPRSSAGST